MSTVATEMSFARFAAHEARLMWRDRTAALGTGRRSRRIVTGVIITAAAVGLHWFAQSFVSKASEAGIVADRQTLLVVAAALTMMISLMFSQAIESVTRAYYGRADLDLILSSPAPVHRLFAVRTLVIAVQTSLLSLVIASPVVNALIWYEGPSWFAAYAVLMAFGAIATAASIALAMLLLRIIGPARTRLVSQVLAAIVGAGFVIALQALAIMSGNGFDRAALLTSAQTVAAVPETDSAIWLPALAAMGDGSALLTMIGVATVSLGIATWVCAKGFATRVATTASATAGRSRAAKFKGFARRGDVRSALRAKEWRLLKRDPWLVSQSLQQVLYLLPPALLLWMNYGADESPLFVVVPVIVMAVGQLAGGLAWLAISGEDAHELIVTAPVASRDVLLAKVQAIGTVILLVLSPFAAAMALFSTEAMVWTLFAGGASAASAVVIQLWFRAQANRSFFRRRQVSSRAATICEALVAINWAAVACLAMSDAQIATVSLPLGAIAVTLGVARFIRPVRD